MSVSKCPHQTVGWWIEQLKEFPKDLPVLLSTGHASAPIYCLSIYPKPDDCAIWIDVGDESES